MSDVRFISEGLETDAPESDVKGAPGERETPAFAHLLACPACGGALALQADGAACTACATAYQGTAGQLDLRLRARKAHVLTYELGPREPDLSCMFDDLPPNGDPEITDWSSLPLEPDVLYGNRLTAQLVSYFPRARTARQWMLDLGCGSRNFEGFCRKATGFNYVGVDFSGPEPDLLVDVHALPFRDQSFDFIMSVAVLEHLAFPDVAMAEAFRTLRPGGVFAGTVAFLEPFHMASYFHMTHLGVLRVLREAGFEVLALAPNRQWTGVRAQAEMSLFPGLPRRVRQALAAPVDALSRMLWGLRRSAGRRRSLETTGGFRFVARRPAAG